MFRVTTLPSPLRCTGRYSAVAGAGEMFRVTTLPAEPELVPLTATKEVDYAQDFFGKPAFLTVSGQLSAETMACAAVPLHTVTASTTYGYWPALSRYLCSRLPRA